MTRIHNNIPIKSKSRNIQLGKYSEAVTVMVFLTLVAG